MKRGASRRLTLATAMAAALASWPTEGRADAFYWGLRYNLSVPVGSVRSFVPDVAPVGFDLDGRYWFGRNLSLGIDGAWNRFNDKLPFGTYPLPDGAITGTIHRYVEIAAVLPEIHYYFGPDRAVIPFVGLAAGFSYVWFKVLVSDITVKEKRPGFMLAPEVGILIPYDRDPEVLRQAFTLGLRFAYSTSGFDAAGSDVRNTSFVALQVGALVY